MEETTQAKPVRLEDLIPKRGSFYLAMLEQELFLHPVTLDDEIWMRETFGDKLNDIFAQIHTKDICRIAFHLMEEPSKEHFAVRDLIIMNEQGEKVEMKKGGAELLYMLVAGIPEKLAIYRALMKSLGADSTSTETTEKKSHISPQYPLTGQKSSISSPVNTAGRQNTSSHERNTRSRLESKRSKKGG